MDKLFKEISVTTIFITYLFVCGTLYIIGYWSNFSLDISAFIQIWDIPKSFILPFSVAACISLLFEFLLYLAFADLHKFINEDIQPSNTFQLILFEVILSHWWFEIGVGAIPLLAIKNSSKDWFWAYCCFVLSISILNRIKKNKKLKSLFKNVVVFNIVADMVICTPFLSFGIAKVSGIHTYNNDKIRYITPINNITDTISDHNREIKFLGFLGNKAIMSSLDNKRIIVLNQENFNGFELVEDSAKKK